jgi:membrane-bound serine protease (ClpP class)
MGVLTLAVRAHRGRVVSGAEGMVGEIGRIESWKGSRGWVHVAGENWRAVGPHDLNPGRRARVERMEGLTLTVAPVDEPEEKP